MAVLVRFRTKKIAWIADIEKEFLNFGLPEKDSNVIRYLWTNDPSDPAAELKAYRWKKVPFGLTSSPFQLRATISKHLKTYEKEKKSVVGCIESQLYVDDLLGGADNPEEAQEAVLTTKDMFAEAKLKTTKWTTNNEQLQEVLAKKGLTCDVTGLLAKNVVRKYSTVLGIHWDTKSDCFLFNSADIIKAAEEIGENPTKMNPL